MCLIHVQQRSEAERPVLRWTPSSYGNNRANSLCIDTVANPRLTTMLPVACHSFAPAHKLILQDPRNNSAWNQRWFAVHRGSKKDTLPLEVARHEADYAILTGATLDPYNESPWRYLIGVLKEQPHNPGLIAEYETKTESLRTVLTNALREPEACANWTSARIDLFEMIGDKECLEKVRISLKQGMNHRYRT